MASYSTKDCQGLYEPRKRYLVILIIRIVYPTIFYPHLHLVAKIICITDCLEVILKPAQPRIKTLKHRE